MLIHRSIILFILSADPCTMQHNGTWYQDTLPAIFQDQCMDRAAFLESELQEIISVCDAFKAPKIGKVHA